MISKYNIQYKPNLFLDLHLPDSKEFDLLVYFHGGGLENGSKKVVDAFTKTVVKNGIAIASVDYRLYPNANFPDYIDDGASAIRWLKDNIEIYGQCKNLFVGGSSAGGYISMMLCFDEKYLNAVGMKPIDIAGYIHDAGQPTSHFNVLRELGKDSRRIIIDETAPMYFVGNSEKYAPMVFIVSDDDMFCRYEQTMLMVKALEHFGHKENVFLHLMHGGHCAYVRAQDADGEGVFGKIIIEYINKMLAVR